MSTFSPLYQFFDEYLVSWWDQPSHIEEGSRASLLEEVTSVQKEKGCVGNTPPGEGRQVFILMRPPPPRQLIAKAGW